MNLHTIEDLLKELIREHLEGGGYDPSALMSEIYEETKAIMQIHYSAYKLDTACLTPRMVQGDFEEHLAMVMLRRGVIIKAAKALCKEYEEVEEE
jgi:hypothetical protein